MMSEAMEPEAHPRGGALSLSLDHASAIGLSAGLVLALALALVGAPVRAQLPRTAGVTTVPVASASPPARPPTPREDGVRWQALTPAQREALAPLERDWPSIDAPRKQKWIALAGRFKTLAPEERSRITARMAEWAKLTPTERGQARVNFEEARQLPATDRSARWQAYQALPAEQRQQLAARAATAASGPREAPGRSTKPNKEAKFNVVPNPALAQPPKQVAPTLVQVGPGATTTPITRRPAPPAHQQTGMPKIAATPEFVNRSTLLPKRGPQAAAVASASVVTPVASVPAPIRPTAAASTSR